MRGIGASSRPWSWPDWSIQQREPSTRSPSDSGAGLQQLKASRPNSALAMCCSHPRLARGNLASVELAGFAINGSEPDREDYLEHATRRARRRAAASDSATGQPPGLRPGSGLLASSSAEDASSGDHVLRESSEREDLGKGVGPRDLGDGRLVVERQLGHAISSLSRRASRASSCSSAESAARATRSKKSRNRSVRDVCQALPGCARRTPPR